VFFANRERQAWERLVPRRTHRSRPRGTGDERPPCSPSRPLRARVRGSGS
jgi:hypothetical protein